VDHAADDVPDWGPAARLGEIEPGITVVGWAKLGATKPAIKPTEAHCLVLIALCEVLIPFGAILTRFGEILTPFGEVPTPLGLVRQPAPGVSLREILLGLLELLPRL